MDNDDILNKDLYKILNIEKNATADEIKSAYRHLMRIYHPDINETEESKALFKEIRDAYEILSDTEKKKLYDIKHGFNFIKNNSSPENEAEEKVETQDETKDTKKTQKLSDILSEIINGIFVNSKGSSNSKKNSSAKQKGEDIYANVTISPKEAVFGTSRIINIVQSKICPNCEGKKFINEALCPLCKGHGEISTHKKINANIPSNVKNNEKIKIEGIGNESPNGGVTGDLYLIVNIDEKSLFTVKDNIVYMDLPITPYEAALGATIEIPTFYENVTIKIPPNTSSGQRFRLKGQGIFLKDLKENSDMIVTVVIKIPNKLSEKEIEIYKSLKENSTCNIREGLKDNE